MAEEYRFPNWRLIRSHHCGGAGNMALDQAILESASGAVLLPTLRLYRWSPPALSIGRFQPLSDIDMHACSQEGIEVVRRPSGGKSILHLDDFTYSVVLPEGFPFPDGVVEAYRLICGGILRALRHLGLGAYIKTRDNDDYRLSGGACFAATTQADLEIAGRKLCGSAQLRRKGSLLQHGSIMLEDHSDVLFRLLRFNTDRERATGLAAYRRHCMVMNEAGRAYSWEDIATSFARGFRESFDTGMEERDLTGWERRRWEELSTAYSSPLWLENPEMNAFP